MSPAALISALGGDADGRAAALIDLRAVLERLVAGSLVEPASRVAWRVPAQRRGDVVHDAWERLARKATFPELGDDEARRYLETTLVRCYLTALRRERERPVAAPEPPPCEAEDAGEAQRRDAQLAQLAGLLDRAAAEAVERRQPRYREAARTAWAQIRGLAFEGRTMADVLAADEGVGPASTTVEVARARARVLSAHRHVRREIGEAIEALAADGRMAPEDARLARRGRELLLRCHATSAADVPTTDADPEPAC